MMLFININQYYIFYYIIDKLKISINLEAKKLYELADLFEYIPESVYKVGFFNILERYK